MFLDKSEMMQLQKYRSKKYRCFSVSCVGMSLSSAAGHDYLLEFMLTDRFQSGIELE